MYSKGALNWRFSKMTRRAWIGHWHAHEGRHTAVSIMSSNGVKLQDISDTVGHKSTHVTETVYRHVIMPAIRGRGERDGHRTPDDLFDALAAARADTLELEVVGGTDERTCHVTFTGPGQNA